MTESPKSPIVQAYIKGLKDGNRSYRLTDWEIRLLALTFEESLEDEIEQQ